MSTFVYNFVHSFIQKNRHAYIRELIIGAEDAPANPKKRSLF
jgi:hypothetical protein